MSLQNIPNLPFPHPFKTLADAENYVKQLRASFLSWTSTLPEHVDIVTMGLTNLADPNDDRIIFWDDSSGKLAWLDLGSSLATTLAVLDTIQDIRTTAGPSFDHLHLTVATGTAPLGITSTTMSPNLNADLLDGYHASAFPLADGTAMTKAVTQVTHGLSVGDVVKCTAANTYAKAQADSAANAEVVGIVASSADADNFVLLMGGYWASASVPAQAAGTVMYLSPTSAGAMTATAPTTDGQVSKPIGVIIESGAKMLIFNWRGVILDTWELLGLEDLTDPGADRIFFWDDGAGKSDWLACGNSVSITDTTLDTIQDIRTSAGPTWDHAHLTGAITENNQAATKAYVDLAVSSIELTEHFSNTASSIGGIYYVMDTVVPAAGDVTAVNNTTANDVALFNFATLAAHPHLDRLPASVYDCHAHLKATGTRPVTCYYKLYKRTTGDVETLLGTSATTTTLTSSDTFYDVYLTLASEVALDLTDRLVIKWFGNFGVGNSTTVTMTISATTDPHFSIKTTAQELSGIFVPYTGAEHDADLGTKSLSTDHIHLPAMTAGSVSGIFHGTENLIRSFMPTGADGYNLFVGDAGNSTLSPGGGSSSLASYNFAFGHWSLASLTTGNQNVAVGLAVLQNTTTGQDNTGVGDSALNSNVTGQKNVALGYNAGYYETGSSKLFIDNASRIDEADGRAKALIYGIFAAATADQYLYINGNLSVPHPITSTLAIGTAPFAVTSTTVNNNLNADMVDGRHLSQDLTTTDGPTFDHLHITNEINVGTYGYFGVNDTTRGIVYAYGHGAGSVYGGTFLAYTSADHDTTIQNYGWMVYEDDLYIGPDTNIDAIKLASTDDLYITAGSLILPASEYVNFGGTLGSGGYGLRDNAGDVEYCDSGGAWTALNTLGGGAGAPTDAQYVCLAVDGDLSAERVLTGTANQITITDNGANGTVVLSTPQDIHTGAGPTFDHLHLTDELFLASTNHAEIGVIYKGGVQFLHDYHGTNASGFNLFLGKAGNFTSDATPTTDEASFNVGLGYESLKSLTTGKKNTGLGYSTLYSDTTGYQNAAIGYESLYACIGGWGNFALGTSCLRSLTSGHSNVAIGNVAAYSITTGDSDIAIGGETLFNCTGSQNIGIGVNALKTLTSGSENVAIGHQAGYSTTGSSSVFIGKNSGFFETAGSKLFIDNHERGSEADARVKALVYGIFNAATASQYFNVNGHLNALEDISVAGTKVLGARVVDARCDDAINSGDATTDGVIDALRDAMIAHGLLSAA